MSLQRPWLPVVLATWAFAPILLWQNILTPATPDNPPFGAKPWVESVVGAWEPDYRFQQQRRFVPQGAIAAGVQTPTASALELLIAAWQPTDPPPIQKRLGVPIPTPDNPPFGAKPWIEGVVLGWVPEPPAPPTRRLIVQEAIAAAAQTPYASALEQLIAPWQSPDLVPVQKRLGIPIPTPDDPQFGTKDWVAALRQAWEPEPYSVQPRRIFPLSTAITVNDPPFGSRPWVSALVRAWEAEFPVTQKRSFNPQPIATVAQGPYNRLWVNTALTSWLSEPLAFQRRLGQIVSVDNPPFGSRRQDAAVWGPLSWAVQPRYLVPQGTPPAVNNPPFGSKRWLSSTIAAWTPEPPATPVPRFSVNDLVFGRLLAQFIIYPAVVGTGDIYVTVEGDVRIIPTLSGKPKLNS